MIKLDKNFTPLCLRPSEVRRLTADYIANGRSVWNFEELKQALLDTSHQKCAYCQCQLQTEDSYMEVEHFFHKNQYPQKVVEWENLLPSCKRCNGAKGTHDVHALPILNPYDDEPKDHLYLKAYRFRSKSKLGCDSIDVINLNDPERLTSARFEVGEIIHESIQNAIDLFDKFQQNGSTRTRNRLLNQVRVLLKECLPYAAYAATSATILHSDIDYQELRTDMDSASLWSDESEKYHIQSEKLILTE